MRRPVLIATAAAVLGLMAGGGFAYARHHCAGPASNFSAYYYQSPGGVPRARGPYPSTRAAAADASAAPYRQSCGRGRVWKDDRCVRE